MNSLSTNQKLLLSALVGFLVGAGAVFVWNTAQAPSSVPSPSSGAPEENENASEEESSAMEETNASESQQASPAAAVSESNGDRVTVADQPAGTVVAVASVNFSSAGWVAVHEDRNGELGNVLGAAWFPAGNSVGVVELLRGTAPGNVYHAVLYRDDGDKAFELDADAVIQTGGNPVQSTFTAGALN